MLFVVLKVLKNQHVFSEMKFFWIKEKCISGIEVNSPFNETHRESESLCYTWNRQC